VIVSSLSAPDTAQLAAASGLQVLLTELVVLSLDAKQAHWTTTGPEFLPLHALTDKIAEDSRAWADRVAKRAVALGFYVDNRPATAAGVISAFPLGPVTGVEATAELVELLVGVTATVRRVLDQLALADAVAHGIAVEILEGLEKYRWMLAAHTS
jgi:starvation-inducible DNA-binding protein